MSGYSGTPLAKTTLPDRVNVRTRAAGTADAVVGLRVVWRKELRAGRRGQSHR